MVAVNNAVTRFDPKENQFELVCIASCALESKIRMAFGEEARGSGLGELTSSIYGRLSTKSRNRLFYLARVRNEVVHRGRRLDHQEKNRFAQCAQTALAELTRLEEESEEVALLA